MRSGTYTIEGYIIYAYTLSRWRSPPRKDVTLQIMPVRSQLVRVNAHAQWRGAKSVVRNLKHRLWTYRHIDIAEILPRFLGHDSVRKKRRPKKVHRWRVVRLPREPRMCRRRGPCSQTEWSEWGRVLGVNGGTSQRASPTTSWPRCPDEDPFFFL